MDQQTIVKASSSPELGISLGLKIIGNIMDYEIQQNI